MLNRLAILLVALTLLGAPVHADCGDDCGSEPSDSEPSEPSNDGNETAEERSSTSGSSDGEPPSVYRLLMSILNPEGGKDCRVYTGSTSDPTKTKVDPDNCWT